MHYKRMVEQKCANCQYYENGECFRNAIEIDVSPFDWCFDHRMDWDKEKRDGQDTRNNR